ncbi:MAG TPA: carboxypeptidase regulatory-like domain-containing protein, partial [Candidatus Cloacimonadota bacterium]|nr:carboxypeptidase regulatory-like domain-containing protein [Candidatus Cloacimonadota bacterium]
PSAEGLYPTWCRIGTVNPSETPAVPTQGLWQAGLGWSLFHQDEWLISPLLNCSANSVLSFDSYLYQGSQAGDHYFLKLSTDQGSTWEVLWDGSLQPEGLNAYTSPISMSLNAYSGQLIRLAWQAVDPLTGDGLWHSWLIDNIRIDNSGLTLRSRSTRALTGYRAYRLLASQTSEPQLWVPLMDGTIPGLEYVDTAWDSLAAGTYCWAVRAVYNSGVLAEPIFSNSLTKVVPSGSISGVVRFGNNQPVPHAQITAGAYSTTANLSGAYLLSLPAGVYSVTAHANGFQDQTVEDVTVFVDMTVTVNFHLTGSEDSDPQAQIYPTELKGNHPNPFSGATTLSYSLARDLPVKLVIFNCRGQRIRELVSETKTAGLQDAIWDCRDDSGRVVANGIYYYHFSAGEHTQTGKMLLLK